MSGDSHYEIATFEHDGCTVVRASGEIDIAACPTLEEAVAKSLTDADVLVIDMAEATFVDSSGLSQLVQCERRAGEAGVQLRLVLATQSVRRVFELTALDSAFSIYPTLDEATSAR